MTASPVVDEPCSDKGQITRQYAVQDIKIERTKVCSPCQTTRPQLNSRCLLELRFTLKQCIAAGVFPVLLATDM